MNIVNRNVRKNLNYCFLSEPPYAVCMYMHFMYVILRVYNLAFLP